MSNEQTRTLAGVCGHDLAILDQIGTLKCDRLAHRNVRARWVGVLASLAQARARSRGAPPPWSRRRAPDTWLRGHGGRAHLAIEPARVGGPDLRAEPAAIVSSGCCATAATHDGGLAVSLVVAAKSMKSAGPSAVRRGVGPLASRRAAHPRCGVPHLPRVVQAARQRCLDVSGGEREEQVVQGHLDLQASYADRGQNRAILIDDEPGRWACVVDRPSGRLTGTRRCGRPSTRAAPRSMCARSGRSPPRCRSGSPLRSRAPSRRRR